MPHYIGLLQWTPQGAEKIKDSPNRLDAARKAFAGVGVQMKDFYMTMGNYDMVCILEAPDDAAVAKAVLTVASKGSIRTQTMRAFTEAEYRSIIGSLA
jgi:uncharacterized protein with GYD domain